LEARHNTIKHAEQGNVMERGKVKLGDVFTGFAPFQALACVVGERGQEWEYLEDLLGGREYLALRLLASVLERPVLEARE